ncbi:rhodanese-like domain-containing protein [Brevibacterium senegalense]|uniref:rhodanese-like domain-containing protein n=1 Tax=Brevibacterium senegalense TaxID=1033736 RepID=UPI00315CB79D
MICDEGDAGALSAAAHLIDPQIRHGRPPPVPDRRCGRGYFLIRVATSWDERWILICRHGYSSSLAAWNLRHMGLHRATDLIGGAEAWAEAGLPLSADPADERD